HVESVLAWIGFLIWKRRAVARFLHPAERAYVLRRHEDVAGTGIECGSTPIRAAEPSWKNGGRGLLLTLRAKCPWCKRPGILNAADLVDQFPASLRVFRSGVCSGDQIVRFVAHARQRRRLHRDRLCWKSRLAGNIAFRNRTLFDAEDRLAGFAIQDV